MLPCLLDGCWQCMWNLTSPRFEYGKVVEKINSPSSRQHFLMWWTSTTGGIIPSLMILIAVIVVFRSLKKDMGDNARWQLILHVEDQNSFFCNRHVCKIMIVISICFLVSALPITSLMIHSQFSRPTTSMWVYQTKTTCPLWSCVDFAM